MSRSFDDLTGGKLGAREEWPAGESRSLADWPAPPYPDPDAWVILETPRHAVSVAWRALDFDNNGDDPDVGRAIRGLAQGVRAALWAEGVPVLVWPSRSGIRFPEGSSSHLFAWMPGSAPRQFELLQGALDEALGRPLSTVSRGERMRLGLDPAGHVYFPPAEAVQVRMGVTRLADLEAFRAAWGEFSHGGMKKL